MGVCREKRILQRLPGLTGDLVSRVERGTTVVTVDTVAALCGVLRISLTEFFAPFVQAPRLKGPRRKACAT
jgi:transcriptional regulator with XRE-family HTH domain